VKLSAAKPDVIRVIGILSKTDIPDGPRMAHDMGRWLTRRSVEVRYDAETAAAIAQPGGFPREELPRDCDLAIVVGGDGSLLSAARAAVPLGIPLLGVNFGSLGFLTELQPDEVFQGLEAVLADDYLIEERHALRVRYRRNGELLQEYALLNDAVLTKSALARMIKIRLRIDEEDVATYTSDGLIVSTPTGSTAYSLSAGGPILDPRMSAFVIAPICPHTMTYRPLVVPSTVQLGVSLVESGEAVYLTLDGQIGFPFNVTDRLEVDDHPHRARLVRVADRPFFEVLRRKLRWGVR